MLNFKPASSPAGGGEASSFYFNSSMDLKGGDTHGETLGETFQ